MARVGVGGGLTSPTNEKADGTVTSPRPYVFWGGGESRFNRADSLRYRLLNAALLPWFCGSDDPAWGKCLPGAKSFSSGSLSTTGCPLRWNATFSPTRAGWVFSQYNKMTFDRTGRVSYHGGVMFFTPPLRLSGMNPVQDATPGSWEAGAGVGGFS